MLKHRDEREPPTLGFRTHFTKSTQIVSPSLEAVQAGYFQRESVVSVDLEQGSTGRGRALICLEIAPQIVLLSGNVDLADRAREAQAVGQSIKRACGG